MPDVTASYGAPFDFIAFFRKFSYKVDNDSCLKYCVFSRHTTQQPPIFIILLDQLIKYMCSIYL